MRRIRKGEWLAGLSAAGLLAVLFLKWHDKTGWSAVWKVQVVMLAALIVGGLGLLILTARGRPVAWSIGAAVATSFVGIFTTIVTLLRVLTLSDAKLAAWMGLLLTALITLGGWIAMADERTGAPESAYTPPPARPAPQRGPEPPAG